MNAAIKKLNAEIDDLLRVKSKMEGRAEESNGATRLQYRERVAIINVRIDALVYACAILEREQ